MWVRAFARIYRRKNPDFKPPAALEDTESTEPIRMNSSVLSVSSNDRRKWVVKKLQKN